MRIKIVVFVIFTLSIGCTPVTINPGNYYGDKKMVTKEKYTSRDERKKKKYYTKEEYHRKQVAKKTKH